MLLGMTTTASRYAAEEAASVYFSIENLNLNLVFNCNQTTFENILEHPVNPDMIEVSSSGDVLNLIMPERFSFQIANIIGLVFSYDRSAYNSIE